MYLKSQWLILAIDLKENNINLKNINVTKMCTTNLCIAFYTLTICVFGWFSMTTLIIIRSSQEQGNRYVLDPIIYWIGDELVNPFKILIRDLTNYVMKFSKYKFSIMEELFS